MSRKSSPEGVNADDIVGLSPADIAAMAGNEPLDLPGWGPAVESTMIGDREWAEIYAERKRLDEASELLPQLHFQNGMYGGPTARAAYVDSLLGGRDTAPTDVDIAVQRSSEGLPNEVSANLWLLDQGYQVEQYVSPYIARVQRAFYAGQITAGELLERAEQEVGQITDPQTRQEYFQYYADIYSRYHADKPKFDSYRESGRCIEDSTAEPDAKLLRRLLDEGKLVMAVVRLSEADRLEGRDDRGLLFKHPQTGDMMLYTPQRKDPTDQYDRQPELKFYDWSQALKNVDFTTLTAVSRP